MKTINTATSEVKSAVPKKAITLIGVCGLIGSGKDAIAKPLVLENRFDQLSFADHLKDVVAKAYGWDRDLLEGDTEESRKWREEIDPFWEITPRSALQMVGVQFRDLNPDFWVQAVRKQIEEAHDTVVPTETSVEYSPRKHVITDVRFPNEFEMIRELGGIMIHVKRGPSPAWWTEAIRLNSIARYGRNTDMNAMQATNHANKMNEAIRKFEKDHPGVHVSEWGWAGEAVDYEIQNDGTLADLNYVVRRILEGEL